MNGIYTLANDTVLDQLLALINSIEANVGKDIPICIIPFDDRLSRVEKVIKSRPQVSFFENFQEIKRCEDFLARAWAAHPAANRRSWKRPWYYGSGTGRPLATFAGNFERFIYIECDNLAMRPFDAMFAKLDHYDLVFDDWEHRKSTASAALNISLIASSGCYQADYVREQLHCGSFFAGKKGLFAEKELEALARLLIEDKEIEWVNAKGWWDFVFLFNYLTLRLNYRVFNFTLSPDGQERTGNCANADPFVNIDNVLYNQQGRKPIHRIHYMNYPPVLFRRLCQGEQVAIPFPEVFLHYRFYHEPEQIPKNFWVPGRLVKARRFTEKMIAKLALIMR